MFIGFAQRINSHKFAEIVLVACDFGEVDVKFHHFNNQRIVVVEKIQKNVEVNLGFPF